MVRLLLVVLASVVVCRAIEVPLCDRSYCSCSLPNGLIGDAVKVDDGSAVGCLCACGRDEGELCSTDDHCAQGTSCAYPRDLSQSGTDLVCTNKCALTKCDQYQRCSLDDNKQPICRSRSFDCDPSVVATVVAVRGNEKQTFPNKCYMVNENTEQSMTNPTAPLWIDVSQ